MGLMWLPRAGAEGEEKAFDFRPPVTEVAAFGGELTMLPQERADYSKNLARYGANLIKRKKASAESLALGRRLLAVALHLSPRSREALVVTYQLQTGVMPKEEKKMDYSAAVFARLLLSRADLLGKQEAKGDQLLARCFVELAAVIDPRNEDAVYAFQIQTLDHGELDWTQVTDASKEKSKGVSQQ
jgi:hypothetical protein